MNLTDTQKQALVRVVISTVLSLIVALGSIFSYDNLVVTPRAQEKVGVESTTVQPGLTYRNLTVRDYMNVNGPMAVNSNLRVTGSLTVSNLISQSLGFNATSASTWLTTTINAPLTVNSNETVTGTLGVTGAQTDAGALTVGGATTINNNATVTGTLGVSGATTLAGLTASGAATVNNNATVTGTLTLGTVAFTGPVHFGIVTGVVSGTTIAHTLGVTPTMVSLTASGVVTTTPIIFATNATSITVGFITGAKPDAMTINWLAGK